jgi:hypothetical protein
MSLFGHKVYRKDFIVDRLIPLNNPNLHMDVPLEFLFFFLHLVLFSLSTNTLPKMSKNRTLIYKKNSSTLYILG